MGNRSQSRIESSDAAAAPQNLSGSTALPDFQPIYDHDSQNGQWLYINIDLDGINHGLGGMQYPVQEASKEHHSHKVKIQDAVPFKDCPDQIAKHSFCVFDYQEAFGLDFTSNDLDYTGDDWKKWTRHVERIIQRDILRDGQKVQPVEHPLHVTLEKAEVIQYFHDDHNGDAIINEFNVWAPFIEDRHLIMKSTGSNQLFANASGKGVIFITRLGTLTTWHSGYETNKDGKRKVVVHGNHKYDVLAQPVRYTGA